MRILYRNENDNLEAREIVDIYMNREGGLTVVPAPNEYFQKPIKINGLSKENQESVINNLFTTGKFDFSSLIVSIRNI